LADSYPQAVIDQTEGVAQGLQRRITDGDEPFNEVGATRMQQAAEPAAELTA